MFDASCTKECVIAYINKYVCVYAYCYLEYIGHAENLLGEFQAFRISNIVVIFV